MDQKCLEEKSTSAFLACRALNGHVRLADVTFTRRVTKGISQALPIIHCALVVLPSQSLRLLSLWTLLSSTFIFLFIILFVYLFVKDVWLDRTSLLGHFSARKIVQYRNGRRFLLIYSICVVKNTILTKYKTDH